MEMLLLFLLLGALLAFLLPMYNQLKVLYEPIRMMDATLDASLGRKKALSNDLKEIATATARLEVGAVEYVQSSIIKAAEVFPRVGL